MSLLGLLLGLALLIWLTMRGVELLIAAPLCALLVAVTSGFALFPQLAAARRAEHSRRLHAGLRRLRADLVLHVPARLTVRQGHGGERRRGQRRGLDRREARRAPCDGAVVLGCAVLTYGGVSLFVVAFSVYPMALSLFRVADVPRRFIPAALAFGSVTFTMTSAGSPEIQNWIPTKFLGTTPYAGWEVSLVVALMMASAAMPGCVDGEARRRGRASTSRRASTIRGRGARACRRCGAARAAAAVLGRLVRAGTTG
jgi:hypothetical protein